MILFPKGNKELDYSWRLGSLSNNLEKSYALLQGISLEKCRQIMSLLVLGYFQLIVQYIVDDYLPYNNKLVHVSKRIRNLQAYFSYSKVFYILLSNDQVSNSMRNKGNLLKIREMVINGQDTFFPIP